MVGTVVRSCTWLFHLTGLKEICLESITSKKSANKTQNDFSLKLALFPNAQSAQFVTLASDTGSLCYVQC